MRWLFLLLITPLFADKTVCLNMIVKNETAVIQRCLNSVKDLIDYWVIVDTGSTDGTQEMIKETMKGIPGELHERPWVDFSHNRNEALQLAKNKADYLLFIDADEELIFEDGFQMPKLTADSYAITVHTGPINEHARHFLVNARVPWRWEGVLHEALRGSGDETIRYIKGVINRSLYEGARSRDPQKYLKDVKILEKVVKENPNDSRSVFYLAQSYLSAGKLKEALDWYKVRAVMPGVDQETYAALYQIGCIEGMLKKSGEAIVNSYAKAFQYRPSRAEPLYRIVCHYAREGNHVLAYVVAKFGSAIPLSEDFHSVDSWIYNWAMNWQLAEAAFQIGRMPEARDLKKKLLANPKVPPEVKERLNELF